MMRSKKALARKILCGLLAAGVVGACGSALAAECNDCENHTGSITGIHTGDIFNLNTDTSWMIDATEDSGDISITSKQININAAINANGNITGADTWYGATVTLGDKNTEEININVSNAYKGLDSNRSTFGIASIADVPNDNHDSQPQSTVNVTAKKLNIEVTGEHGRGLHVQNNTEKEVAPANAATMIVNANDIVIKVNSDDGAAISAYSNGQMTINGNLTATATNAIDVRGNATVNINQGEDNKNNTTVLNGDIVFETPNTIEEAHGSGKNLNANVNVNLNGEGSSWTGRAYQDYDNAISVDLNAPDYHGNVVGFKMNISNGATWNMTGDSFINDVTVADGGAINVQDGASLANLQKVTLADGVINLQGENQKVNIIDEVTGEGTVATNSLTNNVSLTAAAAGGGAAITVQGTGAIGDAIAADSNNAQKLANVVSTGEGENVKSAATKITTQEGKVAGVYTADVKDGAVVVSTLQGTENTTNRAISDMASISLMTWRQENNDMNKRLGELRDSKGEHGAWARMARGESKYGAQNVKNQYNYYQVGYDEKLSVNPNWTVGVALTRTEGTSTFTNGSGENKHTGFALYGSYLKDDGSFIDLIAKYARMDNDYKTVTGAGSGDYETNGYSLSAEYGKRFTKDNGFWIEPQVELTYGRVGSADYVTANGVKVRQDEMNSFVGRLGFSLGKDIKQGNVYVRASYLYDFDGETDVKMIDTASGAPASYKQDLGGGWWEVGVGTNLNLSDATHLYFDVEKTYGGNVATPWQWNAGVRWSF